MKHNYLELDSIRRRTRVTRMVSRAPLRLIETGQHDDRVEVQLASYGGGMLQGDRVALNIRCGTDTGLLLKSQANTHIYRNETQQETVQLIQADCAERSHVVVLPDPVVLHAGAHFRQKQIWNLTPDTRLILADWMQSGRSESQEQFAFRHYESRIEIQLHGRPVVEEHFCCRPTADDIRSPALFGPYDTMLNLYLLGPGTEEYIRPLKPFLDFPQYHADALPAAGPCKLPEILCGLNPLPNANGYLLRALARTRRQLQPILDLFA